MESAAGTNSRRGESEEGGERAAATVRAFHWKLGGTRHNPIIGHPHLHVLRHGQRALVYRRAYTGGDRPRGPGHTEISSAGSRPAEPDRAGSKDGADQPGFGTQRSARGKSRRAAFEGG